MARTLLQLVGIKTPSQSAPPPPGYQPAPRSEPVQRVSVSLPQATYQQLERLVESRGFNSRSQAIAEMIEATAAEHARETGDEVLAGTITLFYDETRTNLLREIASIQREFIGEVISSHHVLLEDGFTLEVVLVQGPAAQLRRLAERFRACRGLRTGQITLGDTIMPPVHPRPDGASPASTRGTISAYP